MVNGAFTPLSPDLSIRMKPKKSRDDWRCSILKFLSLSVCLRPTDVVRSLHLLQLFWNINRSSIARMMPKACWWLPHGLVELRLAKDYFNHFLVVHSPQFWLLLSLRYHVWCESMSRSLLAYSSMCTCHLYGWQLLHSVVSLVNDLPKGSLCLCRTAIAQDRRRCGPRQGLSLSLICATVMVTRASSGWLLWLDPLSLSCVALSHIISLPLCGTAGFSCLLTLSLQPPAV